jgi:DNA-3-methyladenine glycosylase
MTEGATRLPPSFYARSTAIVARALLGQRMVRIAAGRHLGGLICETEAYGGPDDEASHAYRLTPRSAIMYGPPGLAYVYFIYGMHHCLNVVTEADGHPGAVLVRAIIPVEGIEAMRTRRPNAPDARLCDGPGKLCRALGVTLAENGADLTRSLELFIEAAPAPPDAEVRVTPRIGVRGGPKALALPWRFVWIPKLK